jgi:hypothetical protein
MPRLPGSLVLDLSSTQMAQDGKPIFHLYLSRYPEFHHTMSCLASTKSNLEFLGELLRIF